MKTKSLQTACFLAVILFMNTCTKNDMPGLSIKLGKENIEHRMAVDYAYLMPHVSHFADPNNLAFGSVYGGEARLLPDAGTPGFSWQFDEFEVSSVNNDLIGKWDVCYAGIFHCNNDLDTIGKAVISLSETDQMTPEQYKTLKTAELRFLRGFLYFELIKVFGPEIPYYDENTPQNQVPAADHSIWQNVESDFQFASENLPDFWGAGGEDHPNLWAAKAFLAKVKLFQAGNDAEKYGEALTLFEDIMTDGVTSKGEKYGLLTNFDDNFNVNFDNSIESVFAEQNLVDGSGIHGNYGYIFAYPIRNTSYITNIHTIVPGGCCGFFIPTLSLANSFKVDADGLPYLDGSYNNTDLPDDMGVEPDAPYKADSVIAVDPRLDWTIGRRGIPYLNWGLHPGALWIRNPDYTGNYSPVKFVYRQGDPTELQDNWAPGSGLNTPLMRYADVLLMAAECYAQPGAKQDLGKATELVNQIRSRAGNHPVPGSVANYKIGLYPVFASADDAMRAIKFERKLELAMEGHRFFDLARWGDVHTELGAIISHEKAMGFVQYENVVPGDIISKYFPKPE
jgi:hypothetical protein